MGLKIEWSDLAISQLEGIYNYYSIEATKTIAKKIVKNIRNKVKILANTPFVGVKEELLIKEIDEYRYLVEGNYKIIYRVTKKNIDIAFIFDCRQNPKKLIVFD